MDIAVAEEDDEEAAAMKIAMAMSLGDASSSVPSVSSAASEGYSDMPDSGVPPGFTGAARDTSPHPHPRLIFFHCIVAQLVL